MGQVLLDLRDLMGLLDPRDLMAYWTPGTSWVS